MPSRITAPAASETSSAVIDHGQIQRAAIIHDLPREFGGGDGLAVVGNRDDSRLAHRRDFRDGFAFAADAGRANGPHAHVAMRLGAIDDEARDGRVVVHRLGVRHAANGREAAARGGKRAGLDGFGIFLPGFAQVHVHINEARRDDQAGGVEDFRAVGTSDFSRRGDFGDALAVQQNVARRIGLRRGIEHAAVLNQKHGQIPWVSLRLSFERRMRAFRGADHQEIQNRHAHRRRRW